MKKKIKSSRFLSITFTPILFILISIAFWMFTAKESPLVIHKKFPEIYWSTIGNYSYILSILAFILIAIRKVFPITKNTQTFKNTIRLIFRFLTKHHLTIGFAALLLAILHSVYFLIIPIEDMYVFVTGIIDTLLMIITVITGYFFYKKRRNSKEHQFHIYASILFIIFLILHKFH